MLELLVVLAILGGLVALALPRFMRMYDQARVRFEQDDLERLLRQLPLQVRLSGRGGYLSNDLNQIPDGQADQAAAPVPGGDGFERWQALRVELPQNWTMQLPQPILFHFNGACEGGEVIFTLDTSSLRYKLTPPLCRPELEDDSDR